MARVRVQVPIEDSSVPVEPTPQPVVEQPATTPVVPETPSHPEPHNGGVFNRVHPKHWKLLAIGFVTLLVVIFLIGLVRDRNQLKKQVNKLSSSQPTQNENPSSLAAELSKTVELPADESPQLIAVTPETIKSIEKLPAFSDVKEGDKILIYAKARRMVIYRPDTKKVITAVTLVQSDTESTPTGTQTAPPSTKVNR